MNETPREPGTGKMCLIRSQDTVQTDSTPTSPDKDRRVDTPLFPSHPAMEPPAIRPGVPSWQEERNVINPDRDHCLNAACGQQAVTEKKLRGHNPKNQEHE